MAQVQHTLEDDILKDLMLGNREAAVSKLLEYESKMSPVTPAMK